MALNVRGYLAPVNNGTTSATSVATTYSGWTTSAPQNGDFVVVVILATAASETFSQTAGTGTWTIPASNSNAATEAFTSAIAYKTYVTGDTAPTFSWGTGAAYTYFMFSLYSTATSAAGQAVFDAESTVKVDTTGAASHTPNTSSATYNADLSVVINAARYQTSGSAAITMSTPCSGYSAIAIGGYGGASGQYANSVSAYISTLSSTGTVTPGAESFNEAVANNAYTLLVKESFTVTAGLATGTGTSDPAVVGLAPGVASALTENSYGSGPYGYGNYEIYTGIQFTPLLSSGTGTAQPARVASGAYSRVATGTGTAQPTGVLLTGLASAMASAQPPSIGVDTLAGLAPAFGGDLTPSFSLTLFALSGATGAALNVSFSTVSGYGPSIITAVGAAQAPAVALVAGLASATGTAIPMGGELLAGLASGAGASPFSAVSLEVDSGLAAAVTRDTYGLGVYGQGLYCLFQAVPEITATAVAATATGASGAAGNGISAGSASGTGHGRTAGSGFSAVLAAGTGTVHAAQAGNGAEPGTAASLVRNSYGSGVYGDGLYGDIAASVQIGNIPVIAAGSGQVPPTETPSLFAVNVFAGLSPAEGACSSSFSSSLSPMLAVGVGSSLSIPPEISPPLVVSGFGNFPQVTPGAIILSVIASVTQYGSNGQVFAPYYELWDSTNAIIGTSQPGTQTVTPGNTDLVVFSGVTYNQLATLQLKVYGTSVPGNTGASVYVDAVSLSVSWTVNETPVILPGTLPIGTSEPAATVSTGQTANAVIFAGVASFPAVAAGVLAATAYPSALSAATAEPAVLVSVGQAVSPGTLAVVSVFPAVTDPTEDYWATADATPGGGWANAGNAVGAPDGSYASWVIS